MKFVDYIIAEDIRFEIGNKYSLMGIYGDEIELDLPDDTQWPIPFQLGVFIRMEIEDSDPIPNRFILEVNRNDSNVAKVNGNIKHIASSARTLAIPIALSPFPLPGYGTFQFNFEIFDNLDLITSGTHNLEIIPKKLQS
jgi:hypothetical protein